MGIARHNTMKIIQDVFFYEWFVYRNFANDEFTYFLHSEDQRRNWKTLWGNGDLIVREELQGVKRLVASGLIFVFTLAVLGASVCLDHKQTDKSLYDTVYLGGGMIAWVH